MASDDENEESFAGKLFNQFEMLFLFFFFFI